VCVPSTVQTPWMTLTVPLEPRGAAFTPHMMVAMSTPRTTEARAISSWLEQHLGGYLESLRELCSIECPSGSKPGIDFACQWVQDWTINRGWNVKRYSDAEAGDSLVVSLGGGSRRPKFLLAAHLDTVYPVGTAAVRPMVQHDDRLLAPGIADNKSGLLSGLFAMAALEDLRLLETPGMISLFCGADEETDMRTSLPIFSELAPQYDLALVLEAGRENGDIVEARKTSAHYVLEIEGREAHAGVEPHRGANAILSMAHRIVRLQALNEMRPGVTVNVGVVQGGTMPNVVPGYARAEIDVRAVARADLEPVTAAIQEIVDSVDVPHTKAALRGGWKAPPMPRTSASAALVDVARSCAQELGFDLQAAATGGISYANYLAGLGLPVLDGLGPVGGLDHSPAEFILRSSIVPRTALLALMMLRHS
jgi:glutamate carboxypeptidase